MTDFIEGLNPEAKNYIDNLIGNKIKEEVAVNQKRLIDEVFEKVRIGGLGNNSIYLDSKEGFYIGNKLSASAPTRIETDGNISTRSTKNSFTYSGVTSTTVTYTLGYKCRFVFAVGTFSHTQYQETSNGHADRYNLSDGQCNGMSIDTTTLGSASVICVDNYLLVSARNKGYAQITDWTDTEVKIKYDCKASTDFTGQLLFIA